MKKNPDASSLIRELVLNPKYGGIRNVYINNFNDITIFINKFGRRLAIEDISKLEHDMTSLINENRDFIFDINSAISKGEIKLVHLTN